jgi:hypothetical protein
MVLNTHHIQSQQRLGFRLKTALEGRRHRLIRGIILAWRQQAIRSAAFKRGLTRLKQDRNEVQRLLRSQKRVN